MTPEPQELTYEEWLAFVEAHSSLYGLTYEESAPTVEEMHGVKWDYTPRGGKIIAFIGNHGGRIDYQYKVVFLKDGTIFSIADSGEMRTIFYNGVEVTA